jgi:hypothetical protein
MGLARGRAGSFGVWPRTFPAFVNEPCVGMVNFGVQSEETG